MESAGSIHSSHVLGEAVPRRYIDTTANYVLAGVIATVCAVALGAFLIAAGGPPALVGASFGFGMTALLIASNRRGKTYYRAVPKDDFSFQRDRVPPSPVAAAPARAFVPEQVRPAPARYEEEFPDIEGPIPAPVLRGGGVGVGLLSSSSSSSCCRCPSQKPIVASYAAAAPAEGSASARIERSASNMQPFVRTERSSFGRTVEHSFRTSAPLEQLVMPAPGKESA